MTEKNLQVLLAARPVGMPREGDFRFVEGPVPDPGEGEVLVRNLYLSLDPAMRGWMNEGKSYIAPVQLGAVMRGFTVGEVIASRAARFAVGDLVQGSLGWQRFAVAAERQVQPVPAGVPLPAVMGVLGGTGMTAYFGLLDIGQPKAGETVVVSGAAGAVGSIVGQIAKIKGCRAVGIAGGAEKCGWLTGELGFDAAIDYKATPDLHAAIKDACPKGVDVYFDNVGGEVLDTVLRSLAVRARVVICGAISQYNNTEPVKGPANYLSLLVNRARMEGFIIFDYVSRFPEAQAEMARWLAEGRIKHREDIVQGLENAPTALLRLFTGANTGKLLIQIAKERREG